MQHQCTPSQKKKDNQSGNPGCRGGSVSSKDSSSPSLIKSHGKNPPSSWSTPTAMLIWLHPLQSCPQLFSSHLQWRSWTIHLSVLAALIEPIPSPNSVLLRFICVWCLSKREKPASRRLQNTPGGSHHLRVHTFTHEVHMNSNDGTTGRRL